MAVDIATITQIDSKTRIARDTEPRNHQEAPAVARKCRDALNLVVESQSERVRRVNAKLISEEDKQLVDGNGSCSVSSARRADDQMIIGEVKKNLADVSSLSGQSLKGVGVNSDNVTATEFRETERMLSDSVSFLAEEDYCGTEGCRGLKSDRVIGDFVSSASGEVFDRTELLCTPALQSKSSKRKCSSGNTVHSEAAYRRRASLPDDDCSEMIRANGKAANFRSDFVDFNDLESRLSGSAMSSGGRNNCPGTGSSGCCTDSELNGDWNESGTRIGSHSWTDAAPPGRRCSKVKPGRRRLDARPKCKLNESGCVSLQDILLSFNGPISEEQAWALCHQSARCFAQVLLGAGAAPLEHIQNNSGGAVVCYELTELSHVLLHKDGDVHPETLRNPPPELIDSRKPLLSEKKVVLSLGMVLFKALDFGMDGEEERPLAPDLEALITLMTQPEREPEVEERLQETDDEGIERDSGDSEMDEMLHHDNNPYRIATPTCNLNIVLQLCTRHLQSTSDQADAHYRAVVRALVAEALELSHFLEKVAADKHLGKQESSYGRFSSDARGDTTSSHLDTLDFNDWARFWVQVIGELRRGVKLKKVAEGGGKRGRGRGRGAEFELTPYEILMDDIRARRYRLRKTPAPAPHLRKDAHAVILEFIRSRPPLKKASERKLPPLKRQSTPRELLMESIKRPPRPLRPSTSPIKQQRTVPQEKTPTSRGGGKGDTTDGAESELVTTPKSSRRASADLSKFSRPPRKLIPVDFDLKLDGDEDDEDDDEEYAVTRFEDEDEATNYWSANRDQVGDDFDDYDDDPDDGNNGKTASRPRRDESGNPWKKSGGLRLTRNEYHRFCDNQLESYDLATQCLSRRASARRHTVVGAPRGGPGSAISSAGLNGTASLPHSRPQSRQQRYEQQAEVKGTSAGSGTGASTCKGRKHLSPETTSSSRNSLQDELSQQKPSPSKSTNSAGGLDAMFLDEHLSLTLEEIVHIRSVLTKAELESLPVEGRVKEDVEKRRVCFLCLKTRFGILGPWGQRCRLCERTVCVKCYSKMRIPTEHFAQVPVVLLSPGLLLSPSSTDLESSNGSAGGVRSLWPRPAGGVGSAPASPAAKRRDSGMRNTTPTPTLVSTPLHLVHQDDDTRLTPRGSPASGSHTQDKRSSRNSSRGCSPARGAMPEQRIAAERLRGVAMVVCHDCRIMVLQIIKSSRSTRATIRNNVISRLTLNLSPVYV